MATVNEAETARTALGAALKAGLDTLDLNQTITFTLYQRVVLPLDGYVFWVNAAISNIATTTPLTMDVMGALHYTADLRQEEDNSVVANRVVFSAEDPVQNFSIMAPSELYFAVFDGVRFAFSSRGSYFQQSNLHHYIGNSFSAWMMTQIIDNIANLPPTTDLIVSNSLPIWLSLSGYNPAWHVDIAMPAIPLFPSFLSPQNFLPPYGTVHVEPEQTTPYQAVRLLNSTLDHSQLTHDRVIVTLYGCSNRMALDFLDATLQYTLDTDNMGIVGVPPIVRDDKKTQTEALIIAQKKRIVFEVSYYQSTVRNIARQMIERALVGLWVQDSFIGSVPIQIR
jgi:hypothetical protein